MNEHSVFKGSGRRTRAASLVQVPSWIQHLGQHSRTTSCQDISRDPPHRSRPWFWQEGMLSASFPPLLLEGNRTGRALWASLHTQWDPWWHCTLNGPPTSGPAYMVCAHYRLELIQLLQLLCVCFSMLSKPVCPRGEWEHGEIVWSVCSRKPSSTVFEGRSGLYVNPKLIVLIFFSRPFRMWQRVFQILAWAPANRDRWKGQMNDIWEWNKFFEIHLESGEQRSREADWRSWPRSALTATAAGSRMDARGNSTSVLSKPLN